MTPSNWNSLLVRVFAVGFGLAVAVAIVEVGARVALGAPIGDSERLLFTSRNTWATSRAAVHYASNAEIRSGAIYGEHIAYDVRYRTNDLGLVDHQRYRAPSVVPVSSRWAFVGDSFTAGVHGGDPWVPRLRDELRRTGTLLEIYNLGVGGTGFSQFLPTLAWASRELEFGNVAILFISDDLTRQPWRPIEHQGRIILCPKGAEVAACREADSRIFTLEPDDVLGTASLIELARARGLLRNTSSPREWFARHSWIANASLRTLAGREAEATGSVDFSSFFAKLDERHAGRKIVFVHIPERKEVNRGSYRIDVSETIRAAGFEFIPLLGRCGFERADYLRVDRHFNAKGYRVLSDCVRDVLELDQQEYRG